MEESNIFMGTGGYYPGVIPQGDYRIGIGKKLRKAKKAKRKQSKQSRKINRK